MSRAAEPRTQPLPVAWGVGHRALQGEIESGDLHVVAACENGALIAVIDGLGHGPEAATAARIAAASLRQHPDEPPTELLARCHRALQRTRGAVMSLASIDARADRMTWIGVGNVDGTLYRADRAARPHRESLSLRGGVVGYQMPALRPATVPIAPGDVVVFATDGVRGGFHDEWPHGDPQTMADDIVARYGKASDDALVLIARYVGRPS
jgi:phosphoserine phosphatase RsbX